MTTQIQAFRMWLDYHRAVERTAQERQQAVDAMRSIVNMAQNGPPDGGGDGSFTRASWELARKMATLALVFMTGVVVLGIIFAAPLIAVLAPGFDPEKSAFAVELTRIMFPFILLVSMAALAMGMLNSRNVFGVPALASSFYNLGSIFGGVTMAWWIDPTFGPRALIGMAIGTLLGGFLQMAVQLPSLRKVGFRFHFDFGWNDPEVKRVLVLMLPAVIAASAVQVNVMVNSVFASYLGDGAVSWLAYAFRLMQLPLGIFGVAIATVTLPAASSKIT
jgi:putative peptidoglycan lipid II flippase